MEVVDCDVIMFREVLKSSLTLYMNFNNVRIFLILIPAV